MIVEEFVRLSQQQVLKLKNYEICSYTYRLSRQYCQNWIRAIDVGSKFGFYSTNLQNDFLHVEAFDMRDKMRWKSLDKKKVNFYCVALGETSGEIEYSGASTGITHADKTTNKALLKTLDSYNFNDVNYIKIDVEGDELSVLKGAKQTLARCRPLIILEQNNVVEDFKKGTKFQARDWLLDNNYKVVDHNGTDDWILQHV